jgi:hypothetical protein
MPHRLSESSRKRDARSGTVFFLWFATEPML